MFQRRVEVHSLGWCRLGRRELGTWIVVSAGKSCERLSVDWFGNPSNTLEPSLWIHIPGSGVTLLLRFGTVVSTVGWKILGLQPVGVIFIKISALYYGIIYLYMNVFHCVFIYRLIESLEYACLLFITVHVIKYFLLCVHINLKGIDKRTKPKGGLEGGIPRPVGGRGVLHL
jgi:hypothetical protein